MDAYDVKTGKVKDQRSLDSMFQNENQQGNT